MVGVRERSRATAPFLAAAAGANAVASTPAYLEVSLGTRTARLDRLPRRPEIPVVCDEQLVVEHYSR